MIPVPAGVRVWLAAGHTDLRRGFPDLALIVQETLKSDLHTGHLFGFRGKLGDLVKINWHDGQGACLFSKRLEPNAPLVHAANCLKAFDEEQPPHHHKMENNKP